MIWSTWWAWMVLGLVLGIFEMMVSGWVFLGFALGAVVTGLLLLVGGPLAAAMAGSVPLLVLIFALLSLAAWLLLRRLLGPRGGTVKTFDHDINDN